MMIPLDILKFLVLEVGWQRDTEGASCFFMSTNKPVCLSWIQENVKFAIDVNYFQLLLKQNLTLFGKSFPFQMCPKQTYELCETKEIINYVCFPPSQNQYEYCICIS